MSKNFLTFIFELLTFDFSNGLSIIKNQVLKYKNKNDKYIEIKSFIKRNNISIRGAKLL